MADENGNQSSFGSFEADEMPWLLPTNVLDDDAVVEACDQNKDDELRYLKHHQPKRHHSRSPPPPEPLHHSRWRSNQLRSQRTRNVTNTRWAFGGPGMQAVFLGSGQRSCGTGVFLPRRAGTQCQSSNKPACPPVLLPYRVVQALNLNIHELQLQNKSCQEYTSKQSKDDGVNCNLLKTKRSNNIDASTGRTGGQWCSPEIFLPKEWTY